MIIVLDASKMIDKENTHMYLKNVLSLPDYYGNNLDALHDCLEEMTDVKIIVMNEDSAGDYYTRVKRVLHSVSTSFPQGTGEN